jgi:hypothetical protein
MWKLIALVVAVGAFAAPAMAGDQIQVKGSDSGTFSLAPAGPAGIYLSTDISSGLASHLGRYDFLAHETYDANHNVVTQASFTISTKHGTLTGNYTATLGVGASPNIATYHAPDSSRAARAATPAPGERSSSTVSAISRHSHSKTTSGQRSSCRTTETTTDRHRRSGR